jgi:DNA replicative helicase MCM subunit Mcm2 (Cdc46/Mcm family)
MNKKITDIESIKGMWDDLIETTFKSEYETTVYNKKSFNIDFWKIDKKNSELSGLLIDHPLKTISGFQLLIHEKTGNGGFPINLHFNGESIVLKEITNLRTKNLNKLTSIEGFVVQTSEPYSRIVQAKFRCKRCGNAFFLEQPKDTETLYEPFECPEESEGCGRSGPFELLPDESLRKDFQKVLIQNPFYDKQRIELEMHLYDDHIMQVFPGEWVTFNGIYLLKNQKTQTPKPYFLVRGIEQSHARSLEYTEEEKKLADELPKDPQLWNKLIRSFSPSIYGNTLLKESLLLQLFGGVWHDLPDGTTRRGSIHVLFAGDPGTAKSVLKQGSGAISPRFSVATGKGASVAGLTAGATKSKIGDREGWVLSAGALVLANGGVCYLDEFDKIPDEVQGCLHGPMEQGMVETSKIGAVNQRLPSRTAVFGAMNPKHGRFDNKSSYFSQIHLDSAMKSRFDLIFAVKDIVNKERDRMISNHMNRMLNGKHKKGYLDTDFLRKYVYHAKQIKPVLGKEVSDYITNKFVDVRQKQEVEGVELHNITFRQNETLRRLAEASARSRFSKVVERCDVDRAWRVFRGSLESLGMVDLDGWMTQWTVNTRKVLREIEPVLPSSYQTLREMGFSESELDLLIDNNAIFEKEGWYYKRKK